MPQVCYVYVFSQSDVHVCYLYHPPGKAGGHKAVCGNIQTLQQHKPDCAYANKNPAVVDEKLAETGQLLIVDARSYVLTTGLNTCICVVVQTEGPTLAWHAKHEHQPDVLARDVCDLVAPALLRVVGIQCGVRNALDARRASASLTPDGASAQLTL